MEFTIRRENLLKPLQLVTGVVEKRQTMPILSNALIEIANQRMALTCTDTEIELVGDALLEFNAQNPRVATTVAARKLLDICRVLPENSMINFYQESAATLIVRSGKSRFVLTTLPTDNFPSIEWDAQSKNMEFTMMEKEFRHLLETTKFAMAQNDARYYLNGLLLEMRNDMLCAVGADGHRMALNGMAFPLDSKSLLRVIIPRKGVVELVRMLDSSSSHEIKIALSDNHIRVVKSGWIFTCKLIDGQYPPYEKTIPRGGNKKVIANSEILRQALSRVAIFSSDLYCGVEVRINTGLLSIHMRSQNQEEGEEEVEIDYQGEEITTGFNINYLLDALSNITTEKVVMTFKDGASSVLMEELSGNANKLFVIMPLRL